MIVAPSDHWIEDETAFANDVKQCFEKCGKEDVLCTLGIKPTFPNTGFGYIEFEKESGVALKKVYQFREKPDYETAKDFIAQGNFLWNAGIFMWSVKTIIDAFKKYQPSQFILFEKGMSVYNTNEEQTFINENYPKAENISIDYAILEPSKQIFVLLATFDWNDLGTWGSLYDKLDKDADYNAIVNCKVLSQDAGGNMISSSKNKIIVVDGLKDYIIVDKEDVLLIYPKSKEQDIKQVLVKVKDKFGIHYT
jgi:mannose-1-phosphate guanylyltransferase